MRPHGQRRVGELSLATAMLAIFCAGCCSRPPPAERFFDRLSPEGTLRGFVYAVDTHQWRYAYDSLTEETREHPEMSLFRFQVGLQFFREPESRVLLYDLISNALRHRGEARSVDTNVRAIRVITRGRSPDGTWVYYPVEIPFRYEAGEWHLDVLGALGIAPGERLP